MPIARTELTHSRRQASLKAVSASRICNRIVVMHASRIVEPGLLTAVFGRPQHAYARRAPPSDAVSTLPIPRSRNREFR